MFYSGGQRVSIHQRISDLVSLLNNGASKDYHQLFHQICGEMFGYVVGGGGGVGTGWNLVSQSRKANSRDFASLQYFLSPSGPFFNQCIYKLMSGDPHCKFSFPVNQLVPVLMSQQELMGNSFLTSRLNPEQREIFLNPFEFYFVHFAYLLVKPQNNWHIGNTGPNWIAGDTLYPMLMEDYCNYFLPCDGSDVIPTNHPVQTSINRYIGTTPPSLKGQFTPTIIKNELGKMSINY